MALDAIGSDSRIVLFGDEEKIKSVLASEGCPAERFGIVATTEVIEMGDHPAKAFQAKADSSIPTICCFAPPLFPKPALLVSPTNNSHIWTDVPV